MSGEKMLGDFYKSSPDSEMICSEFVANTTIAALVELNEQLKL